MSDATIQATQAATEAKKNATYEAQTAFDQALRALEDARTAEVQAKAEELVEELLDAVERYGLDTAKHLRGSMISRIAQLYVDGKYDGHKGLR